MSDVPDDLPPASFGPSPRPAETAPPLLRLDAESLAGNGHAALAVVARWTGEYLAQPHPDLGRDGPVCPFVPGAMAKRLLFATVYVGDDLDVAAIRAVLLRELERFVALKPVSGNQAQWKSLLVLFPDLPAGQAETLIEQAQAALQPDFVANGLMVGEFHTGPPDKRGLWNPMFKPLHAPVSMLVIRHMVPTDLLFLKDDAVLFKAYAGIYGHAVPDRFRPQFDEAADRFDVQVTAVRGEPVEAAPRVISALDAAGVRYRVHRHDSYEHAIRTPADFARAVKCDLGRITKTLFMASRDGGADCLVVCGMDCRVETKRLAEQLGVNGLEMASLKALQRRIGYPPTSVTPIGVDDVPVYLDAALLTLPTIFTGSGVPRVEIELAPQDLVRVTMARIVALV